MQRLQGRVAVITGAASGIGAGLAEVLAEKGCALALVDIDPTGLERSAEAARSGGCEVSAHLIDVADREAMSRLPDEVVAAHGGVHILINNAGVSVTAYLEDQSLEDFEWLIGVNLWGVVHGCKFFLPHLLRAEEAHITNLSSVFGIIGLPGQMSYNASKFAVRGITESLHAELAGTRVGVSCVHPGGVRTSIVESSRMQNEGERRRIQGFFDRRAIPPRAAAEKIVRAIERKQLRVRLCPETFVVDWAMRFCPVLTPRLVAWSAARERIGAEGKT